jgi:hypothetical protein
MPAHIFSFVRAAYVYAATCACRGPAPFALDSLPACDEHAHKSEALQSGAALTGRWRPRVVLNGQPEHAKSFHFTVRSTVGDPAKDGKATYRPSALIEGWQTSR